MPEIKWLKDGQPLITDRHHQILSHGRFLQISGAQIADTGRYSCLASNSAGSRSRHFNLNVLGTCTSLFYFLRIISRTNQTICMIFDFFLLPSFFFSPVSPTIAGSGPDGSAEEITVTLSNPTSLLCEVQSYPPALITWLKDGTPFESSRNVRVLPGLRSHTFNKRVRTEQSMEVL